ncbi:MAG: sulfite exporter TauE/SafE family protein [Candidatus Methanoperedens sp.]|nr:sulfite exporter TauE/SafE family protein [Candidatus Methanoperedens sp.]
MKILLLILITGVFALAGCIESSSYTEVTPSQLILTPGTFEGQKICTDLVSENSTFSEIQVLRNQNFTGELTNGTLAQICGIFKAGQLEPDSVNPILIVTTEKEIYHSNETLKVHIDFNATQEGQAQLTVSGIRNDFGRALINGSRDEILKKGRNGFDFEFSTPSCEACSALSPGVYAINATVTTSGITFETYKKITLEREETNVSSSEISNVNGTSPSASNSTSTPVLTPIPTSTSNINLTNIVTVEYFYIPGCAKCEKATPVIEKVISSYGSMVNFIEYNANEEGSKLAIEYQIPGTPSVIINKNPQRLISYENYNGNTSKLENLLRDEINKDSISTPVSNVSPREKIVLSVPSVFVVGLLAGFNPCLLAILAFIASVTLANTGRRRDVLLIVLMFSLGIFVTYLVFGIGLLSIIESSPGLQGSIKNFLIALIGILGIWHLYDAYHLRKNTESSFYTPKAFIRLTESVTKKVSLPASFFIGALFSLIKAPCVGAVYFVVLDMVRSGKGSGYLYLAAYNFGVVLPVLVIGGAIAFGLNPEKVEKFRKDKRSMMRLITGITLLGIAILMYLGII